MEDGVQGFYGNSARDSSGRGSRYLSKTPNPQPHTHLVRGSKLAHAALGRVEVEVQVGPPSEQNPCSQYITLADVDLSPHDNLRYDLIVIFIYLYAW